MLPPLLTACVATGVGSSADPVDDRQDSVVSENADDKIAFDYFVGKGLTDVQAAGIVGNLDQESGMSPTVAEYGGGPGRGIAQWSVGGRWDTSKDDNVAWYAKQHGASRQSLELQLAFIWYELTTLGYGYSDLLAATTVTAAVAAFQDSYEICGACDASNRIAHAKAALAAFGGSPPPPASSSSGSSSSSSGSPPPSCVVDGASGTCIDAAVCASIPGHTATPGFCAGAANIECCTPPPCSVNGVAGVCIDTSVCASMGGTSTAGLCPGGASEECCTQ